MDSVWYGLSIVAIYILLHWYIINDGMTGGETKGLLAMKPPDMGPARVYRRKRERFSMKKNL